MYHINILSVTICNITGNHHDITTLSSEQTKFDFSLPIPLKNISVITVDIPASFQREEEEGYNVRVIPKDQQLIKINWY